MGWLPTTTAAPAQADTSDLIPQPDADAGTAGTTGETSDAGHAHPDTAENWARITHAATKIPAAKLPPLAPADGSIGPAQLANNAVTRPKLADNAVSGPELLTTTRRDRAVILAAIGAAPADAVTHIDTEWTGTLVCARSAGGTGGDVETGNDQSNLLTPITIDGITSTIARLVQDGSTNDITLKINGHDNPFYAALLNKAIDFNGHRFRFDRAKIDTHHDDPDNPPTQFTWDAPAAVLVVGNNAVTVYEPIDDHNYLPGGGTPSHILGWAAGGRPIVATPADYIPAAVAGGASGLMTGADKTALDAAGQPSRLLVNGHTAGIAAVNGSLRTSPTPIQTTDQTPVRPEAGSTFLWSAYAAVAAGHSPADYNIAEYPNAARPRYQSGVVPASIFADRPHTAQSGGTPIAFWHFTVTGTDGNAAAPLLTLYFGNSGNQPAPAYWLHLDVGGLRGNYSLNTQIKLTIVELLA